MIMPVYAKQDFSIKCGSVPIKIAVIDTGYGYKNVGHGIHLCKYGHKDFTNDRLYSTDYDTVDPIPVDTLGHGTNVTGLIDKYAKDANFCIVIVKYYSNNELEGRALNTIKAIHYATNIGVNIINYSSGGQQFSKEESKQVKKFLDQGGIFITAAGNNNQYLDRKNAFYPALDDPRVIVVGNKKSSGVRSESSNYGKKVMTWEVGENQEIFGIKLTGTSQASAVHSGKVIKDIRNNCAK